MQTLARTRRVPNPDTPAGRAILKTASELFYERGIRAVGVDLIALEAGTTKKTIYDRFGSKDALVAAYLSARVDRWHTFLADWLATHAPTPGVDQVVAVLDAESAWSESNARGCALVNAHAELGGTDHPANEVVRAEKEWMRVKFIALTKAAGVADATRLGSVAHLIYEGMIVTRAAARRPRAAQDAREGVRRLLTE